jgi:hypothetical protein
MVAPVCSKRSVNFQRQTVTLIWNSCYIVTFLRTTGVYLQYIVLIVSFFNPSYVYTCVLVIATYKH